MTKIPEDLDVDLNVYMYRLYALHVTYSFATSTDVFV